MAHQQRARAHGWSGYEMVSTLIGLASLAAAVYLALGGGSACNGYDASRAAYPPGTVIHREGGYERHEVVEKAWSIGVENPGGGRK
jgi:hypothetical protein